LEGTWSGVASLRVPDTIGRGLDEVGVLLRKQFGTPRFRALVDQLQSSTTLSARFAATVQIFEQGQHDEELADRILRFWSGEPLSVTHLKRMAKELGIKDLQLESLRARELALQTFTFLPLLMRAAGLRGWVLLIDELELIGRYTRLGRAQSYAELARWMGALDDARPGLVTVGAITADFAAEVLEGKRDLDEAGPYITLREPQSGPCAETGMRLIQRAELLKAPDRAVLQHTYGTLKDLHSRAYGWTASDVAWPEASCESAWCGCCGAWAGTSRPREPRTSWTPGE